MRLLWLGLALLAFSATPRVFAQTPPPPPAPEPPPPEPLPPPPTPPSGPTPPVEPVPPPVGPSPPPESAPATEAEPETERTPDVQPTPPSATRDEQPLAATKPKPAPTPPKDELPPFERAHRALTLEGKLGLSWRPEGDGGFDDESGLGSELGVSLYLDVVDEIAVGLEADRVGLGRGSALSGKDSISIDYSVLSTMLGFRAYPLRRELLDVYVGLQVGVGFQVVSAGGTRSDGSLQPARVYTCDGTDSPGFQIGGGVGARLMLAPRVGISARLNATGRRLTGEVVDACARGIGTSTTVSGSLGLGYDFDLSP